MKLCCNQQRKIEENVLPLLFNHYDAYVNTKNYATGGLI